MWLRNNRKRSQMGAPTLSYFDRTDSLYWQLDENQKFKVNWTSVWVPVRRGLISIWIFVCLNTTFQFANQAGLNPGVVSTLFTTCLIWVAIYFYFKHGQKLRIFDMFGMAIMITAVCLISLSKQIINENQAAAELSEEQ